MEGHIHKRLTSNCSLYIPALTTLRKWETSPEPETYRALEPQEMASRALQFTDEEMSFGLRGSDFLKITY